MPKKSRNLTEDVFRRLFISLLLIYFLGWIGLLLSLFFILPILPEIAGFLQEKPRRAPSPPSTQKPPAPKIPEILQNGLIFKAPEELYPGVEALIKVGFKNTDKRSIDVEIDLRELSRYGRVHPERLYFHLRGLEERAEFIKFTASRPGTIMTNLRIKSGPFRAAVPLTLKVSNPAQPRERGEPVLMGIQALFSRYSGVEPIGEGGFARVYKARKKDGRVVALKIPHHLTEQAGRTFLHEVSIWSGLKHRNIVELYDANIVPVPYLEMEYCEGSLAKLETPLHWEKVAEIAFEICEGLKYAHRKGIVHRDLKPSNVLLKRGIPKISDWGLSKVVTESSSTTTSFTPLYAAPEQISPSRFGKTDERTDIWQLGVLMYELVTGRVPFGGEDFVEIAGRLTMEDPVPPSNLKPDAKPLEQVIMRCLKKKKEERYQSVKELQRDLVELLGGRYREELRKSVDFSRSAYYAGQLLLLHMKLGDAKEALKYARDLLRYARGREREELEKLIEQIELRVEEGLPVPRELVEKGEVVVHEVSGV